jgi:hypothetical protein
MFKKRLKHSMFVIGMFLVGIAFLILWVILLNYLRVYEGLRFLSDHKEYIGCIGVFFLFVFLLYLLGKFINWLFIQPFRYWIKNK